ncbi:MAG: hypothetical protein R3C15_23455 [Thermoleophilia bacterium]
MVATYAVLWREPGGPSYTGRLGVGCSELELDGRTRSGDSAHAVIGYGDLSSTAIGHAAPERIDGRPALVLSLQSGRRLLVASIAGAGVLIELADTLARLRSAAVAQIDRAGDRGWPTGLPSQS